MNQRHRLARLTALIFFALSGCNGAPSPAAAPAAPANPALSAELSYELSVETEALHQLPATPDAHPLDRLFYKMAALRASQTQSTLRILQIGDSHTAGDFLSGDLRDLLQDHFGNAGIGARAAGLPYLGMRQKDFTLNESGDWHYHNSLTDPAFGDYGLSGFTAVSGGAGDSLSLTPVDAAGFDTAFVDFVRQPHGGVLQIFEDGSLVSSVSTAGPAGVMGHAAVAAPAGGAHELTLVAGSAGIELLDWSTERFAPGVIMDSFGVVGSTAGIFDNWNPPIVQRQLQILHPALIILAYGTNEGADTDFNPADYAQTYAGILADLRNWAPWSSILVEAPTDGAHQPPGCPADVSCPWSTLPALAQVRQIQQALAARYGAAYFDASVPMMVSGGIDQWADAYPPLARRDHIHFTVAGYRILATTLYVWLMKGFEEFEQTHPNLVLN